MHACTSVVITYCTDGSSFTECDGLLSVACRSAPLPVCSFCRYSLTHRGAELAHRLLLVGSSGEAGTPPSPHSAGSGTVYSSRSGSSENEVSSKPQRTPSSPPPTLSCPHANPVLPQNGPSGFSLQMPEHHVAADTPQPPAGTSTDDGPVLPIKPLQHWYVDNEGQCVLEKDKAAVTFNCKLTFSDAHMHTHTHTHTCAHVCIIQSRSCYPGGVLDKVFEEGPPSVQSAVHP